MPREFDLVCIGSGPAGQRAAVQAAKLGKRVAVIERRRMVGCVCVDTGTIPSKTFREAVFLTVRPFGPAWIDFFADAGPRVTMEQLLARIHHVMQREAEIIGQAVMAFKGGLDYFLHTVFNYATLAECYKVAGLEAANKLHA